MLIIINVKCKNTLVYKSLSLYQSELTEIRKGLYKIDCGGDSVILNFLLSR